MLACAPWEWIGWTVVAGLVLFVGSAALAGAWARIKVGPVENVIQEIAGMCDWSNPNLPTPGSHRAWHSGSPCPYEQVVPALLRGEPDPRSATRPR